MRRSRKGEKMVYNEAKMVESEKEVQVKVEELEDVKVEEKAEIGAEKEEEDMVGEC